MRLMAAIFGAAMFFALAAPGHAESVVTADGVRIVYGTRGEGDPAVVLVHGWSCDRGYWKDTITALARDHLVVAIDLGGHGESGLNREKWTIASFGADVAAAVDKLKLDRVVLVGHSMGGDVIVEAARKLPGRVAGLIWVDTYKQIGPPRTPEQIQAFLAPFRTNFPESTRTFVTSMFGPEADPELVERIVADMSSAPPVVALGAMESALANAGQIPAALQELKLPVVAVNPDNAPTDEASLESHGVRVRYVEGTGHFPMAEDPREFNSVLRKAINDVLD